ncbi:hypothetical protein PV326_013953, partial [Microctonus aethiopoides]
MKTITGGRDALLNAFELLLSTDTYRIKCEETEKFNIEGEKKARFFAQSYAILVGLSLTSVIRSALMNVSARILPFNGWFPFKHADTIGFFISLSIQTAVYNMDWYSLSLKTQRDLLMIIARAANPVTFTGGPIVTLSLESFVN